MDLRQPDLRAALRGCLGCGQEGDAVTGGSAERGDPEGVIGTIVKPWADALPSLALRLAPGDSSNQVVVRIGRLRHQPFRLRLEPEKRWGEAYGSQFVERYSHGYVSITSPWADDWTERDECAEWTYRRWIEHWLQQLIARYLDWGPDIVRNGEQSLPEWVEGLDQARRLGEDHIPVEAAAQRFMELAPVYLDAVAGAPDASAQLAQAVCASEGGLGDPDAVASLVLAHGAKHLPAEALTSFVQGLERWLPQALGAAIAAMRNDPRHFDSVKRIADDAPPAVGRVVVAHLNAAMEGAETHDDDERALRDQIVRYNALFEGWQTYSPSCAQPLDQAAEFLELEATINAAWWAQLAACDGLLRSELEGRLVRAGRFLSGATGAVLGWMRIHGRYDQAMTIFSEQADDLELFVLRARSQPHAFENMVFCALGSYLDCGSDEHVHEAAERIEALEARYEWATGRADYQIACLFARSGDVEAALRAIERCAQRGAMQRRMAHDTDLEPIWDEPRFIEALATLDDG